MATESESPKPIWTTRDKITVAVCALGWLFIVLRYYPGDIGRSMYETGLKMFWSSGLAAIFTRLLVRLLVWIEKTRPSWPRIIKILLALAIAFGIMLAIEDYKKYHTRPATEVSRRQILSSPNYPFMPNDKKMINISARRSDKEDSGSDQ
ncbi:MAG: hypothetical protein QME44_03935 [Thermodesulfobacteriota bacterium]|nr:hypothetical protein [Thermodesulfobacteriota bacterium]